MGAAALETGQLRCEAAALETGQSTITNTAHAVKTRIGNPHEGTKRQGNIKKNPNSGFLTNFDFFVFYTVFINFGLMGWI